MMSELDRSSVDDTVDDTDPFGSSVTPEAAASLQVPDLATHTSTTPTHSHRQDKHNLDPARFLLELLKFRDLKHWARFCFHTSSRWHNLAQARFHYTHYRYWDLGQARFHYTHYRYWDLGQARFHYTHNRYWDLAQARSCFEGVWCDRETCAVVGNSLGAINSTFQDLNMHTNHSPPMQQQQYHAYANTYTPPPPPPPPPKLTGGATPPPLVLQFDGVPWGHERHQRTARPSCKFIYIYLLKYYT